MSAFIPTNCCLETNQYALTRLQVYQGSHKYQNINRTPTWVLRQQPRLKQSVQETNSSFTRLITLRSWSSGCLKVLVSLWKATSARMSNHSCWTRTSVTGNCLNLPSACNASASLPFDTSQRGLQMRAVRLLLRQDSAYVSLWDSRERQE